MILLSETGSFSFLLSFYLFFLFLFFTVQGSEVGFVFFKNSAILCSVLISAKVPEVLPIITLGTSVQS